MPNGNNIFKILYGMDMETMCGYMPSKYSLPHWKFVLCCCSQFPCINLPSPELDHHNSHVSQKIHIPVYQQIPQFIVHGRRPFNEKKQYKLGEAYSDSIVNARL